MKFQEKGFLTPPPGLESTRNSPVIHPRLVKTDLFHVIHKVPSGDSPYVRAKRVQLIEKDPCKAVSLFWAAINSGDRVDSSLKDMAVVMKQLDRSDEAIEAIKSFRHLCPPESQESLDNVLLELYKRSGRYEEEIQMMHFKLNNIEEDFSLSGKRTKISRFQGKKVQVPIEKEYIRLLGNLAWSYLQRSDYKSAEVHYRKALSFELDRNKQCNLAICLIQLNKLTEAELLLQTVKASYEEGKMDESSHKSFERAAQMLDDIHSQNNSKAINREKPTSGRYCTFFSPHVRRNLKGLSDQSSADQNFFRPQLLRRMHQQQTMSLADANGKEASPSTIVDNMGMNKTAENGLELLQPSQKIGNDTVNLLVPTSQGKSWADMVEEEENGLLDDFADENKDSNIIMQTPYFSHQDRPSKQQNEYLDLKDCYYTQPLNDASSKTQVARRALCFDQHQKPDRVETCFSSPLFNKNLDFGPEF